jgi:hypothetical protein
VSRPLAIDLFCGLGGWSDGFLAEVWDVVGFDIERHDYGTGGYPGQLVLQDVMTLTGAQFRHVDAIVASPPCQEFSYMAMPWSRAKQIAKALKGQGEFPEGYTGSRTIPELTALFDACFRIQREACEAAGRHIPMVVENVRGAQPWVGRAPWNYGSFYLWGDVPALMPFTRRGLKTVGHANKRDGHSHTRHLTNQRESDALKVPGLNFHEYEKTGKPGRSFQSAAVEFASGVKNGNDWFGSGEDCSLQRRAGSGSTARKAASAAIAKIPFDLASHIARCFKPEERERVA